MFRLLSLLAATGALVLALSGGMRGSVRADQSGQGAVVVTASTDRDRVTVGDRITLTLTVEHDAGVEVALPDDPAAFGEFDVLDMQPFEERSLGGGRSQVEATYVIAAFATGSLTVPPLEVTYRDAGGLAGTAASPPMAIGVESVLPPGETPQDIRDLKPQLTVPGGLPAYVRPAFGAAASLIVLIAGLLLIRSPLLRRRAAPTTTPPPLPEDVARSELDRIAGLGLPGRGEHKTYYQLIGASIRRYLTDRYDFPAFAMSTTELETQMIGRGVGRWQARLVTGLLAQCDSVRYAQYVPAPARAEGDLTAAYEIVELTRSPAAAEPLESGATP
jgi:hypothetical protein